MPTTAWYIVYSKPQKEELAQFHLKLKAVETFFPRLLLPKFSRKRKRIVPLFPNYLFVNISLVTEYYHVLWTPGVKCFVSFNDIPVPLDDGIAEYLMQKANSEGIITARSDLKVGQEVHVCGGSFEGLIGMLVETPDAKGRVKVLMKLLSREIKVELPVHLVAGTWVPHGSNGQAETAREAVHIFPSS
jgi:transcription elongation factor/antiterminator RfaH